MCAKVAAEKPRKPLPVGIGSMVMGRYEVVSVLGNGGFGSVFKVRDKKTKDYHALKVELEKPTGDEAGVQLEVGVLKFLQCNPHFLQYIDSGQIEGDDFVIMQLAGQNLSDLRKFCPKRSFTLSTTMRLAEQTLDAIENMHGSGLLHRDIKGANFTIGFEDNESRNIYLLDFGLVRQYKMRDGTLRAPRQKTGFRDLGRHDDLWSWLYMVYEFQKGQLPWQTEKDRNKVCEIKEKSKNKLQEKAEPEFSELYDGLLTLTYYDEPPYHTYRAYLYQIMQRKEVKSNDPFDWEPGGAYYKEAKSAQNQSRKKKSVVED